MEFTIKDSEFFKPLTARNARFYFECAVKLIEKSKEMPVMYERDAKEIIAFHAKMIRYELMDEEDGEDKIETNAVPSETAGAVIARFRKSGWIAKREIGRNGENMATITARCRKVIETIRRVFDTGATGALTNHIFSIYEILYSALEWKGGRQIRPYTNILEPLIDHEFDLREELVILRDGIHGIMNHILQIDNANALGSYMAKDELLNRFFRDYFFMKKDGMIPGTIASINVLMARLQDSEIYPRIISEYQVLKGIEKFEAERVIEAQFDELSYFLNHDYDEQMSEIDEKIAAYYNLYAARISMVRNNSMNTQNYISKLLMDLKDMDPESREGAIKAMSESMRVMSFKMVGSKSLGKRRVVQRDNDQRVFINDVDVDDAEIEALTAALYNVTTEKFGIDAARNHIKKKLSNGRKRFAVMEEPVTSREEALMIASAVIFSGADGFPYHAEFDDDTNDNGIAEMSNFVITLKEEEEI